MTAPIRAVCFDLLSALLDSWTVWDGVAAELGATGRGRPWRQRYLQRTAAAGTYLPYLDVVAAAAEDVGLSREATPRLEERWDTLRPWPEVAEAMGSLTGPKAVVTNCSEALGPRAVASVGVPFGVVVTAERAGAYKPNPAPYRLACEELGLLPEEIAYVAGSPFDAVGAQRHGFQVTWVNRLGDPQPPEFLGRVVPGLRGWRPVPLDRPG